MGNPVVPFVHYVSRATPSRSTILGAIAIEPHSPSCDLGEGRQATYKVTAEKRWTSADGSVSSELATGFKNRIPNREQVRSDIACLTLGGQGNENPHNPTRNE